MLDLLHLTAGTVCLRPYVFAFLSVYLLAASVHLGWRRTLLYIPLGYTLAWISEFASIHWGFPYGDYYYIATTADRELWVFGVPFMDSLSYVFLSYCSYSMAIFLRSPLAFTGGNLFVLETREIRRSFQTLVLGAFLFVLLDIITDPVAIQGERWFLGKIYGYRNPGVYFGIPMSNFGGWLIVGLVMMAALQYLDRFDGLAPQGPSRLAGLPAIGLAGPLLYLSVLAFNLVVTFWIGEALLGAVGCIILFFTALMALFFMLYKQANQPSYPIERHCRDFPFSSASVFFSRAPKSFRSAGVSANRRMQG